MKKRVNISIGEKLHAAAIAFGAASDIGFSELVSNLLREAMKGRHSIDEIAEVNAPTIEPGSARSPIPASEVECAASVGMRFVSKKPYRNRPCPCGSDNKYKRCCEKFYPLVHVHPFKQKSCDVSRSPGPSFIVDEQDDDQPNEDEKDENQS